MFGAIPITSISSENQRVLGAMPLELGVHTKDHRNASQVPIPKPNHSEDIKN